MATLPNKNEGLIDGMPRDKRGNWQPEGGTKPANPVFAWPPKPVEVAKWLYHYLFPWNLFYMVLATLTWLYFQPDLSRTTTFRADWIIEIFIRNQILLIVFVSIWHIRLWGRKSQGLQYKYTSEWLATKKRQFLWGNQLYDNIFWSCVSGGITWMALRSADVLGLCQWGDPLCTTVAAACLLCISALSRTAMAAVPLLLGPSTPTLAVPLQGWALSASQKYQCRPLVWLGHAPRRAYPLLQLHPHSLDCPLASHSHAHECTACLVNTCPRPRRV